jgi:hypothetical protein
MGHCYHHALSSVKKWGGVAEDYLRLHQWFDIMWTSKPFLLISPAEVVAVRVARISAQWSGRGGARGRAGPPPPPLSFRPHHAGLFRDVNVLWEAASARTGSRRCSKSAAF